MELRQLIYFEAVARQSGFTRAAEELHVAQSAISAQVGRLERELGVTLFERTTRRVRLTQAGEVLLTRARAALAEVDGARADLRDLSKVLRGRLSVGATPVLGPLDLPHLLAGFHGAYPDVDLTVRTGMVAELLAQLDSGVVDVVMAPIHPDLADHYLATELAEESLVLISPPGTIPRRRRRIRLGELADRSFACLPEGSGLREIVDRAAQDEGFDPRVQFEASDPRGVRAFVGAGLGVALLARSAADEPGPRVDVHPLADAPTHPPIGVIRRRNRRLSPTLRAWSAHLDDRRPVAVRATF